MTKKSSKKPAKKVVARKSATKPAKKPAAKKIVLKVRENKPASSARPKTARKVTPASEAIKIIPFASKDEMIREARLLRRYITYFRSDLGGVIADGTPPWTQTGIGRLDAALAALDGFPDLNAKPALSTQPAVLKMSKKKSAAHAASLASIAKFTVDRAFRAPDRDANEAWYEKADETIDGACLNLELFGKSVGDGDGPEDEGDEEEPENPEVKPDGDAAESSDLNGDQSEPMGAGNGDSDEDRVVDMTELAVTEKAEAESEAAGAVKE